MNRWITASIFVLALAAGCNRPEQGPTGAKNCCQCPGVWNDPPTDPQTYRIAPDCQNNTPGVTECQALCKSLGFATGGLEAGSCKAAPAGQGNTCQ
jgi:hypothetical protein